MRNLSEKQLKFIWNNFHRTKEDLKNISKEEWFHIREDSFMISADELVDEDGNFIDNISEECKIAESIADMKYSELMEA